MKKWECTVCGYIFEGDEPPDECPVCGADSSMFEEIIETSEEAPKADKPKQAGETTNGAATWKTLLEKGNKLIVEFHLHPIAVHAPNGIVPMALLFLFITTIFATSSFETAAFYSLFFVLLNMPAVLYTGYVTWQNKYQGAMTTLFKMKIGASIVATSLLFILILWRFAQPTVITNSSPGRFVYLLLSCLLLAAVGVAGHMGGKLVFANDKK